MQVTKTVIHITVTMQDLNNCEKLHEDLCNILPNNSPIFAASDIALELQDELRYQFLASGEADVNYTVNENLELFVELV